MKKIKTLAFSISILFLHHITSAQDINWASLQKEQSHILNVNTGLVHGVIFGAGYGYQLNTKMPVILNAEYSFPAGNRLFDDYKTKIGGQIRLLRIDNFNFSAKVHGVFRRYQNDLVRMVNFGSDMGGVIGYYQPKWFIAAEVGFDKAIVTNFKHSAAYREIYPLVEDGWYEPATGGNFNYGVQAGFSGKRQDFYIKAGKLITQDFKTAPFVPFYAQLGCNFKINK